MTRKPSAAYQAWANPTRTCAAQGCSRRTKNKHGFCFQHSGMAGHALGSALSDEQLASIGATVPAGFDYTARRDRAIADAAARALLAELGEEV